MRAPARLPLVAPLGIPVFVWQRRRRDSQRLTQVRHPFDRKTVTSTQCMRMCRVKKASDARNVIGRVVPPLVAPQAPRILRAASRLQFLSTLSPEIERGG